jgi:hypothetical protein
MGEKYNDCWYEYDYGRPRIRLGFLPEEYRVIQGWGDAGRGALSRYDARRDDDVRQTCTDVRALLTAAGRDENALLAAAPRAVERLRDGVDNLEVHTAESQAVFQNLDSEGTIPTKELADEARAHARRHNTVLDEEVGPLEAFVGDLFATVRSSVLNMAGAQVEEGLNRMRQLASTGTAGVYRAIRRRGLAEPEEPEAGSAAEPA